jgi:50S ribosomal subunit-associated GTPase HflX
VLNKLDRLESPDRIQQLSRILPNPVAISATDGQGIGGLLAAIEVQLQAANR